MLSREFAEGHLKELKSELRRWQTISRSNPWPYVREYIGVLERRIAAYEKLLPNTRKLCHHAPKKEVKVLEHWRV